MASPPSDARRSAPFALLDLLAGAAVVVAAILGTRPRHAAGPAAPIDAVEPVVAEAKVPGQPPGFLRGIDRVQRRFGPLAFLFAVVKKFGDDQAGRLAALVAYYSFFSIFPLMLVAVTVIGYVVNDRSAEEFQNSALAQIPVVGTQIAENVKGLSGSLAALVIGSVTALWAGLGAMQAAQDAMNAVWAVPRVEQPNFFKKRFRSLIMLVVVGLGLVVATAAPQVVTQVPDIGPLVRVVGLVVTAGINAVVFLIAFQVLIYGHLPWRALLPGAVAAGIGYTALQLLGQVYVERTITGAQDTYGTFAVVIGLLSYLYLLAQLIIFCAEISNVSSRRLWPRGLTQEDPTDADREVAAAATRAARVRPDTRIRMGFAQDEAT